MRDLLLGRRPKDFDVATDARPEEIRKLFRHCRLIGRRFRLAHVRFGREIIEVATFRALPDEALDDPEHVRVDGRIVRDNVYGTLEEDAFRRDFTVNCLYYDINDFSVVDYTGGMDDLNARALRLIGDPAERYREDPVRMLRAIRFAAKLGLKIHPETSRPIGEFAPMLREIPSARIYEEVLKLFLGGSGVRSFELLRDYGLFGYLFPETEACIEDEPGSLAERIARRALASTDARIAEEKPVTPAFLFAALLWEPVVRDAEANIARGMTETQAYDVAGLDVVEREIEHVALPRRYSLVAREIWSLQPRLADRKGKRSTQLLDRPRFRAAYDFLLLRAEAGEDVAEAAQWWTRLQDSGEEERKAMTEERKRPRRRRRRRRPRGASSEQRAG